MEFGTRLKIATGALLAIAAIPGLMILCEGNVLGGVLAMTLPLWIVAIFRLIQWVDIGKWR